MRIPRVYTLFLFVIVAVSCSTPKPMNTSEDAVHNTNAQTEPGETLKNSVKTQDENQMQSEIISLVSCSRQIIMPGYDDGSGQYKENWSLVFFTPEHFSPVFNLQHQGHVIPIEEEMIPIKNQKKSTLDFSITYPIERHYNKAPKPWDQATILYFIWNDRLFRIDVSSCEKENAILYPTQGN